MTPRRLYLILCILGIIVPYTQFAPFVRQHGLDLRLLFQQAFATRASAFFALDVIVAAAALWVFVAIEGRRIGMRRRWAPLLALLTVGVSLGLPLFLYMRERHLDRQET